MQTNPIMTKWSTEMIPDLSDKVVIITGGNSGIGYETSKISAENGAEVIIATRNPERGHKAVAKILSRHEEAKVVFMKLDLADLESVNAFCSDFLTKYDRLDYLFNNAGVMMTPFMKSAQGYEYQFAVNHLGHFALTGQLLSLIKSTPGARVISTSSMAHKRGRINFDDLLMEENYDKSRSYRRSKVCNILFAYELQRRFETHKIDAQSIATHPGVVGTNLALQENGLITNPIGKVLARIFMPLFLQSSKKGARSQLRAAYDPKAQGGEYYGPAKESKGDPIVAQSVPYSHDKEVATKLWEISEKMTGIQYNFS